MVEKEYVKSWACQENVVWLSMIKGTQYKKVTFFPWLNGKAYEEKQKLHKNITNTVSTVLSSYSNL